MFGPFMRDNSKGTLKERLKLVLAYDRANLRHGTLEDLKAELLAVLHRYLPEAAAKTKVAPKRTAERITLKAHLPITRGEARPQREPPRHRGGAASA